MMSLLVHYQESSGSKEVDPVLLRDEDGSSHTGVSLMRRLLKIYPRDLARVEDSTIASVATLHARPSTPQTTIPYQRQLQK